MAAQGDHEKPNDNPKLRTTLVNIFRDFIYKIKDKIRLQTFIVVVYICMSYIEKYQLKCYLFDSLHSVTYTHLSWIYVNDILLKTCYLIV